VFSLYLVKHSLCQSVANHSNVMFKSHSKLPVTDQHITTNVESDSLRFDTCNTTISPLISESISIPDCHVLVRRCFSSSINLSHWFLINSFRCYGFRLSVAVFFDRRTFAVLHLTCSWRVTTYVGKPSAIGQADLAFHPFGSIRKKESATRCLPLALRLYCLICQMAAPCTRL